MMKKEKETGSQSEIYLVDIGNDNGEVKGGTYLGREDIFFAEENKNGEGKRMEKKKYCGRADIEGSIREAIFFLSHIFSLKSKLLP